MEEVPIVIESVIFSPLFFIMTKEKQLITDFKINLVSPCSLLILWNEGHAGEMISGVSWV